MAAEGELDSLRLGRDDCPGLAQSCHDRRVPLRRWRALAGERTASRPHPRDVDDVLHHDGHALEDARAVSCGGAGVDKSRFGKCRRPQHGGEALERVGLALDPVERRADGGNRGRGHRRVLDSAAAATS
jgi:hypothetical protein